jgi:hypothetical protein
MYDGEWLAKKVTAESLVIPAEDRDDSSYLMSAAEFYVRVGND